MTLMIYCCYSYKWMGF